MRRRVLVVATAVLVVAAAASARWTRAAIRPPHVAHVVVVVFENHEESAIDRGDRSSPFEVFADRYVDLIDYTAVAHPSLPNYLALVSGSTHGVTDDCTSCGPWSQSIGSLLTRAGKSWGGYGEGYPSSPLFVPHLGASQNVAPLTGI